MFGLPTRVSFMTSPLGSIEALCLPTRQLGYDRSAGKGHVRRGFGFLPSADLSWQDAES